MNGIPGSALLWPAQQLINAMIGADAHLRQQLAAFTGRRVAIQATNLPGGLGITLQQTGLELRIIGTDARDFAADATIRGSAGTLARVLLADHAGQALVNRQLQIQGDAQLVQDLFTTVKRLDLQWQDLLAPWLGELATQQFSALVDTGQSWARDSHDRMRGNLEDYLKQECKAVPDGARVKHFQSTLDQLRLRLDRLEARTARLAAALDCPRAEDR